MQQILFATQTTSGVHEAAGGLVNGTVLLSSHAGGTWTLQVLAPDDSATETWIDTSVTFTANGIQSGLVFERTLNYRLTGGTAGALAWISDFA